MHEFGNEEIFNLHAFTLCLWTETFHLSSILFCLISQFGFIDLWHMRQWIQKMRINRQELDEFFAPREYLFFDTPSLGLFSLKFTLFKPIFWNHWPNCHLMMNSRDENERRTIGEIMATCLKCWFFSRNMRRSDSICCCCVSSLATIISWYWVRWLQEMKSNRALIFAKTK